MPTTLSRRLRLPGPDRPDPVAVPDDVRSLRDAFDAVAVGFLQAPRVDRPAAGTVGRIFFATDTVELFYDSGAAWRLMSHAVSPPSYVGATGAPAYDAKWDSSAVGPVRFWRAGPRLHMAGFAARTIRDGAAERIFTLPTGFRPRTQRQVAVLADPAAVQLTITPGGEVRVPGTTQLAYLDLSVDLLA
jgi:hypothetical protein